MDWHGTPKDDAWKQAHLAMLANLNMRLMLRCDVCSRSTVEDPRLFAARHNLDLLTPMLTVSKAVALHEVRGTEGKGDPRAIRWQAARIGSSRAATDARSPWADRWPAASARSP